MTAFFACLYYAALRPEEAVALRSGDVVLPAHGWGMLILTGACPGTGSAWTSTGTPHEPRGLKHRDPLSDTNAGGSYPFMQVRGTRRQPGTPHRRFRNRRDLAHAWPTSGLRNRLLYAQEPGLWVAGVGFEPT